MTSEVWFEAYDGQTTDELLALEDDYRIDSLVLAFEEAVLQKEASQPISLEERYILSVEALEREVNNGGYSQFFLNSSNEYVDVIEDALQAIGCPKTATVTRQAIESLGISGELTADRVEEVVSQGSDEIREALEHCDDQYLQNDEAIADRLFEWIKRNREAVLIGNV